MAILVVQMATQWHWMVSQDSHLGYLRHLVGSLGHLINPIGYSDCQIGCPMGSLDGVMECPDCQMGHLIGPLGYLGSPLEHLDYPLRKLVNVDSHYGCLDIQSRCLNVPLQNQGRASGWW